LSATKYTQALKQTFLHNLHNYCFVTKAETRAGEPVVGVDSGAGMPARDLFSGQIDAPTPAPTKARRGFCQTTWRLYYLYAPIRIRLMA